MKNLLAKSILIAGAIGLAGNALALDWQTNEIHVQQGVLDIPSYAGGGSEDVFIGTLQHASGWKYGDTFAFVDYSQGSDQGHDIYGEIYANFSLSKISGKDVSFGIVKDVGILAGYNYGKEGGVRKYLPGVRLALDVPGFSFLNVDTTAYIDDNMGGGGDRAPTEDDSFMVDINWAYPFSLGDHSFSIEGHIEYIGSRDNEYGGKVSHHVLAQPQIRYDLGKTLMGQSDKLFVGVEFQLWQNKYGDNATDERATQFLGVYRF
tara:strand:- start:1915 stop:2700 length:786 start_codon:yes stop_codon:yes gene_type:complete